MSFELSTILILLPIAFFGSLVYGVIGFGSALVTLPLAAHFFPLPFVLAVFALLDLINTIHVGMADPTAIVKQEVIRLFPACIAGVTIGALLTVSLPGQVLLFAFGIFIIVYALYGLISCRLPIIGLSWAYLAGFSGGMASAMFGAGGPPYAIYLSMRPWKKQELRATLATTSTISISSRLVAFGIAGLLSPKFVWITAASVLPATVCGLYLAGRLERHVSREGLIMAIKVLLLISGLSLTLRAVGNL